METIYEHTCNACGEPSFRFLCSVHACGYEYAWVCKHCGVQMYLTFSEDGTVMSQKPTGRRCARTKVLLTVKGVPLAIVADGCRWDNHDDDEQLSYYEEDTCPVNMIRRCDTVIYRGDSDPHGMFSLAQELSITGSTKVDEDVAVTELVERAIELTEIGS